MAEADFVVRPDGQVEASALRVSWGRGVLDPLRGHDPLAEGGYLRAAIQAAAYRAAQAQEDRLTSAFGRVYLAWADEGREPTFHRDAQATLRRDWPILARALDDLARTVQRQY